MGSGLTLLTGPTTQDDDQVPRARTVPGPAMAAPQEYDDTAMVDESEGRFLYLNSTSTSLTLLGALILLGVIFYLVYVGGLLSPAASSYSRYGQDYNQYYQGYQKQCEEFFQCPYSLKDAVKR